MFCFHLFQVHIGCGVWLREDVWKRVQAHTKDSLFVKELAVAIWGTATLKTRSLTGKECPTTKGEAKPPLTPTKLKALRGMFTDENFGLSFCKQLWMPMLSQPGRIGGVLSSEFIFMTFACVSVRKLWQLKCYSLINHQEQMGTGTDVATYIYCMYFMMILSVVYDRILFSFLTVEVIRRSHF